MNDNFDEILQQPGVFRTAAHFYEPPAPGSAAETSGGALLAAAAGRIRSGRPVAVIGMGSSLYAGRLLSEALVAGNIPCLRLSAEEVLGGAAALAGYTTVLISQSGESGELVELVRQLPRVGDHGIVITNTPGSTLEQACPGATLLMHAGEERFSATKTFTNTLLVAGLLGARAAGRGVSSEGLESVAAGMERLIALTCPAIDAAQAGGSGSTNHPSELANLVAGPPPEFVVGCDTAGQVVAPQAGLLFKEVARARTEGHTLGTFRHGPQEVLVTKPRVVFVAERMGVHAARYIAEARGHGANVRVIDHDLLKRAGISFSDEVNQLGFAAVASVLIELWTVIASYAGGYKPGHYLVGGKVTAALG